MLTAAKLIQKCRQKPPAGSLFSQSQAASPVGRADQAVRSGPPRPRAGHSLYDQLMQSHDRVRSRRTNT